MGPCHARVVLASRCRYPDLAHESAQWLGRSCLLGFILSAGLQSCVVVPDQGHDPVAS